MSNEKEIVKIITDLYTNLANKTTELKMKDELIKALQKKIKETNENRYKNLWTFWKANTTWLNECYNVFETKMFNEWKAIESKKPTVFTKDDKNYIKKEMNSLIPQTTTPNSSIKKRDKKLKTYPLKPEDNTSGWEVFPSKIIPVNGSTKTPSINYFP